MTWIVERQLTNVKNEKWALYDLEYGEKHWKTWKMRNTHCRKWNMVRNGEKHEIWKINTVGPGLWPENWQTWKKRNKHCMTWIMARKLTIKEKKTHIVEPGIWRENWQTRKMGNSHGRTWNIAQNNENHAKWGTRTVGLRIWRATLIREI